MVLTDERAHVGYLLDVRIIGVIEALQVQDGKSETNNRLIAVSIHSYDHGELSSLDEINSSMLDQVEEFFISHNKSRGKKFKIKGRHGPKRASELMEIGMRAFQKVGFVTSFQRENIPPRRSRVS
jgi:inorganic pyrophosphatase